MEYQWRKLQNMKYNYGIKNTTVFGENTYEKLNNFLTENNFSKAFILCDENTQNQCVPYFFRQLTAPINTEIIEIESGENNKDIETCQQLWSTLSDLGGDRNAVLINLGGGIITDMGGFVASTFLRGIPFINIPTTLLAMVDASVGGKTGVNRAGLKNQIGLFKDAVFTLIDVTYLRTLPQNQLKSGLAEMLKHGLIADKNYWKRLSDLSQLNLTDLEELIKESIQLKTEITQQDKEEANLRKKLNFGHTLGHAIESCFIEKSNKTTLLHGEAVAIGMILESYLSTQVTDLSPSALEEIQQVILHTFKKVNFTPEDIESVLALVKYDKKNSHGKINFVLLKEIGEARIDVQLSENQIREAFKYYAAIPSPE